MKYSAAALALMLPAAVAAQPFSKSMAQCAALHQNAAQWVPSDDLAAQLMQIAVIWADASKTQSAKEGQDVTLDQVWDVIDAQTEIWEAEGAVFMFSEEFHDWSAYCKSFANNQGIVTTPS